ncbi:MAG: fructose-6-phosphate aldolase [Clostridia bacterium]|nr:fructose-6-phosphate aldolase [Clostridia bacterium]
MELFLDSANLAEIQEVAPYGVISGVTTNPSLVAKENKDFFAVVAEISALIPGPVSAEVLATDTAGMLDEARQLAQIRENVIIKIPMTKEGIKCLPILSKEGIKTNVTLIFSQNQALLAARAGATYVSPFVGRLDDLGFDGISLVQDIVEMFKFYQLPTKVIAASIRHPLHVVEAAKIGADIATIPYKVFQQMFEHPLTASGVEKFMRDWQERVK